MLPIAESKSMVSTTCSSSVALAPSLTDPPSEWTEDDRKADAGADLENAKPLDQGILRGLAKESLLTAGPWLLRNAAGSADTYALSKPLGDQNLDEFISHTWRSNMWLKYLILLFHFNGRTAFVAGHVVALVTFLAQMILKFAFGIPLPVLFNLGVPGGAIRHTGFSFWFGGVAASVTLFFGHRLFPLLQGPCYTFLDKVCIHQTDPILKAQGIRSLGTFLERSRRMLVLWDDDYFERLWCTFELAAFIHYKGEGTGQNIRILPLWQGIFAISMYFVVFISMSLTSVILYFNSQLHVIDLSSWWQFLLFYHVPFAFVCWLPKYMFCEYSSDARRKMRQQLSNFEVRNAKVSAEEDRAIVEGKVTEWFGSLDNFDKVVREGGAPCSGRNGVSIFGLRWGETQMVPYRVITFENMTLWFLAAYDGIAAAEDVQTCMALLLYALQVTFIFCPLSLYGWTKAALLCERVQGRCSKLLVRALAVNVVGLWFPLVLLGIVNLPINLSALVTIVSGAVTFAIFGRRCRA